MLSVSAEGTNPAAAKQRGLPKREHTYSVNLSSLRSLVNRILTTTNNSAHTYAHVRSTTNNRALSSFYTDTVLAASQLRGSCLRHSQFVRYAHSYNIRPKLQHNTNASLIVSIRSLRSLILTASPNREHARTRTREEEHARTRTRGQKKQAGTARNK